MQIDRQVVDMIWQHAAREPEREVCGVLLGDLPARRIEVVVPGQNVHAEPWHHFLLDARTLLAADRSARALGHTIVGFYHSHPRHLPFPSAFDRATLWPEFLIVIAGWSHNLQALSGWRYDGRRLSPSSIVITSEQAEILLFNS